MREPSTRDARDLLDALTAAFTGNVDLMLAVYQAASGNRFLPLGGDRVRIDAAYRVIVDEGFVGRGRPG